MGLPRPDLPADVSHVFVRVPGRVDVGSVLGDAQVVQCQHDDFGTGAPVTEALVSCPDARAAVERGLPGAACVAGVTCPGWVEQSILGVAGREEPAMAAVYALRAPEREWDLVTHPRALSGSALIRALALRVFA